MSSDKWQGSSVEWEEGFRVSGVRYGVTKRIGLRKRRSVRR